VDSLALPTVKGTTYTVVIDPILSGLFVHESFGHLSEADMAYENPDLLEVMSLGRQFGPSDLQIFDGSRADLAIAAASSTTTKAHPPPQRS
jgi:TldD protein